MALCDYAFEKSSNKILVLVENLSFEETSDEETRCLKQHQKFVTIHERLKNEYMIENLKSSWVLCCSISKFGYWSNLWL